MPFSEDNIVSEKFWLNLAGESIQTSFERRIVAVTKLKTIIEWAFALFTGSGFIISIFKDVSKFPPEVLWLLGTAFGLLTIAYALGGEAQYPVTESLHPNDTEEIARSFSAAVKKQSCFFRLASLVTMIGFFLISVSILLLFANAGKKPEDTSRSGHPFTINTGIIRRGDTAYSIPIAITTEPRKQVQILIKGEAKDSILKPALLAELSINTDSLGKASGLVVVKQGFDVYTLRLSMTVANADTVYEKVKAIRLKKPQ